MQLAYVRRAAVFFIALLTLGLGSAPSPMAQDGAVPPPAQKGLDAQGKLQLHHEDLCPVCAMRPAKRPKFAAAIELADQRTYYFCGNGCMIRAWLHPREYLNAAPEERLKPVVQTFFKGRAMDGRQVTWVAGSDVTGPMGPAIVALENPEMAKAFRERHGGKHQFMLKEMTDSLWEKIKGRKALQ